MTLDRNPTDHHAQIEQAAFEQNNLVPGTGLSPDKMLLARGYSYSDAWARLGSTTGRSRSTNCTWRSTATAKDGAMRIRPSPIRCTRRTRWAVGGGPGAADELHWASDGDMVRSAYTLRKDDDDWTQPGILVRDVMDDAPGSVGVEHHRPRVRRRARTRPIAGVRVLEQRRRRSGQEDRRRGCPGQPGIIDVMSIEVVYTAESTASGGGRDGHVESTDGLIDLDTRPPKEMGGSGEGSIRTVVLGGLRRVFPGGAATDR